MAEKTVLKVAVGSKNPVKVNATTQGLIRAINSDNVTVESSAFDVISDVSDQPMTDEETKRGASNRAINAYEAYRNANDDQSPNLSIGLEGGISIDARNFMECFAYVCIYDGSKFGYGKSSTFQLPNAIRDLVVGGLELGDADDAVFGSSNSKQSGGTVGHLTNGIIDRTDYYIQPVVLAYIPFLHPELLFE